MANGSNAAWPGWAACVLCGGVGHLDVDCKYGVKGADGPVARQPVFCEGANVDARDDSQCPPDEASRESEAQAVPRAVNSLRLGSVNVHSLHDPHQLARLLRPHAPFDALAIQEAPHGSSERLHQFAALLGMRVVLHVLLIFVAAPECLLVQVTAIRPAAHSLDNALLVPRSQANSSEVARGGIPCHSGFCSFQSDELRHQQPAQQLEAKGDGREAGGVDSIRVTISEVHGWDLETDSMELRTAVAAALPQGLLVCCTHLCAYKEAARLQQLQQLVPKLQETAQGRGVVMLGDFNSVRRADYSPSAWAELVSRRAKHGVSTETAVTSQLETAWGFRDCRAEAEAAQGRVVTSQYEVRVDYVWADAAALGAWEVARVCHVELKTATDHSLVLCDLRPRGSLAGSQSQPERAPGSEFEAGAGTGSDEGRA